VTVIAWGVPSQSKAYCLRLQIIDSATPRAMKFFALCVLISVVTVIGGTKAQAQSPGSTPTNSLAFHLKSLGRTPTAKEREIIEAALPLMQRHQLRTDFPLRSIRYDDKKKEWELHFAMGKPDAAFTIFLRAKDSDRFWMETPLVKGRMRYPPEKRKR
jgi:hypothetical protein